MGKKAAEIEEIPGKRIFYLDFLRVFSISAVIMIHVAVQNWELIRAGSAEHIVFTVFDGLARFAVPVFVMISGALMLSRDLSIKKILKKVGRIAILWVVWCALYAVLMLATGRGKEMALSDLMFGHYHMWFLPMIAALYLMTPILRYIAKQKWCILVILGLLLVSVGFRFRWSVYPMFYLMGYMLKDAKAKNGISAVVLSVIWMAATAAMVGLNIRASIAEGVAIRPQDADWSILTIMQSVAVFLIVKFLIDEKKNVGVEQKICTHLAGGVLGVYLIHIVILGALNRVGVSNVMFVKLAKGAATIMDGMPGSTMASDALVGVAAVGGTILTIILVTGLSFGAVEILRKVPGARKVV